MNDVRRLAPGGIFGIAACAVKQPKRCSPNTAPLQQIHQLRSHLGFKSLQWIAETVRIQTYLMFHAIGPDGVWTLELTGLQASHCAPVAEQTTDSKTKIPRLLDRAPNDRPSRSIDARERTPGNRIRQRHKLDAVGMGNFRDRLPHRAMR